MNGMPNIQELSVEERLQLVADIWDSIAADTASVPVNSEHLEVVRSRLAAYRADGTRGESARDAAEVVRRNL